jgi:hypothetical protein
MFFIDKKGNLQHMDAKKRMNDGEFFVKMWNKKFGVTIREKKQNIIEFANGIKKNVY